MSFETAPEERPSAYLDQVTVDCSLTAFQHDLLDACGIRGPEHLISLLRVNRHLRPFLDYARLSAHAQRAGGIAKAGKERADRRRQASDGSDPHRHDRAGSLVLSTGGNQKNGGNSGRLSKVQQPRIVGQSIVGLPKVRPITNPNSLNVVLAPWAVRDQEDRGTCVAFATCAAHEHSVARANEYSPQYLYWATKTNSVDARQHEEGTRVEWACATLSQGGVCIEGDWPYNGSRIANNIHHGSSTKPSQAVQQRALGHRRGSVVHDWRRGAQCVFDILARGRLAIVSMLMATWQDDDGNEIDNWNHGLGEDWGVVLDPPPSTSAQPVTFDSAHAVCVTGFVADALEPCGGHFVFRNSWGTGWGHLLPSRTYPFQQQGFGRLSASYVDRFVAEIAELQ